MTSAGHEPDFSSALLTGSHAASITAVAQGDAQLCAVDCVTHALLNAHIPTMLNGLSVVYQSPLAPGLPYITSRTSSGDDLARLRDGLRAALDKPDLASARDTLLIAGCGVLDDTDYDVIRAMARGPAVSRRPIKSEQI